MASLDGNPNRLGSWEMMVGVEVVKEVAMMNVFFNFKILDFFMQTILVYIEFITTLVLYYVLVLALSIWTLVS